MVAIRTSQTKSWHRHHVTILPNGRLLWAPQKAQRTASGAPDLLAMELGIGRPMPLDGEKSSPGSRAAKAAARAKARSLRAAKRGVAISEAYLKQRSISVNPMMTMFYLLT